MESMDMKVILVGISTYYSGFLNIVSCRKFLRS
jgi:hypothetical protein